ncbi:AbrB family transcriptional regulator [Alloscardovia theropitheci]|uniref:AbrB family transcriptional regulator n=1 Tax=Alloscardovia theropitheci TaxID=2496842 RepID=A0A4R0QW41_9BIFI|nr:AbrB family transcriptional regulator [Alloscardovia theropitheci]TCD53700.1 AbrB family transcriptional regulator [Alloscardovia theropitheci]
MSSQESLTTEYEFLRHTDDVEELSRRCHTPLPDPSDAAAFSRATALLEAVAGNMSTPEEDRIFLASTMPYPNILVKLSTDPLASVREAVAANTDSKDWLVGRLTKDEDAQVRAKALMNPVTTWRMRMEGAQDERTTDEVLRFLATVGTQEGDKAPVVLAAMVRRAVAQNPHADDDILHNLASDSVPDVAHAAQHALENRQ